MLRRKPLTPETRKRWKRGRRRERLRAKRRTNKNQNFDIFGGSKQPKNTTLIPHRSTDTNLERPTITKKTSNPKK